MADKGKPGGSRKNMNQVEVSINVVLITVEFMMTQP